jgi:peptidoglycan/LPS O-acetylase OafA/YrhL
MNGSASPRRRHARLDYSPQLDGLRAVAVVAVFLYHAKIPFFEEGGYIGVDVFFVLSGFLITTLLLRERDETGRIALRAFYVRRIRRLAPAAVLVASTVAAVFLVATWVTSRRDTVLGALAALAQIAAWPRALEVNELGWMGHAWSLSVEEHFYLVWPVLVSLALWRWPTRVSAVITVVAAAGIVYGNVVPHLLGWSVPRTYNGPDTRASDILIGCLLAVMLHHRPQLGGRQPWISFIGVLGFTGLALWTTLVGSRGPLYVNWNILVVLASAAVVLHLFRCPHSLLSRVMATPVLVWIGLRSYGIYLIHSPVIGLLRPVTGGATTLLAALITVVLAALSYTYVETPIRRHGFRSAARRASGALTRRRRGDVGDPADTHVGASGGSTRPH